MPLIRMPSPDPVWLTPERACYIRPQVVVGTTPDHPDIITVAFFGADDQCQINARMDAVAPLFPGFILVSAKRRVRVNPAKVNYVVAVTQPGPPLRAVTQVWFGPADYLELDENVADVAKALED